MDIRYVKLKVVNAFKSFFGLNVKKKIAVGGKADTNIRVVRKDYLERITLYDKTQHENIDKLIDALKDKSPYVSIIDSSTSNTIVLWGGEASIRMRDEKGEVHSISIPARMLIEAVKEYKENHCMPEMKYRFAVYGTNS